MKAVPSCFMCGYANPRVRSLHGLICLACVDVLVDRAVRETAAQAAERVAREDSFGDGAAQQ